VQVEMVIPAKKDEIIPARRPFLCWLKLLQSGVEIYETHTAFDPGRMVICDGLSVWISRSSFDASHLNIFHGEFARRSARSFEELRLSGQRILSMGNPDAGATAATHGGHGK